MDYKVLIMMKLQQWPILWNKKSCRKRRKQNQRNRKGREKRIQLKRYLEQKVVKRREKVRQTMKEKMKTTQMMKWPTGIGEIKNEIVIFQAQMMMKVQQRDFPRVHILKLLISLTSIKIITVTRMFNWKMFWICSLLIINQQVKQGTDLIPKR